MGQAIAVSGLKAPARRRRPSAAPDFAALLGPRAWSELPLAVRRRFELSAHHQIRSYPGAMQVRASRVGWLIAQACRLIGTPLAPFTGEDVPVTVLVRPAPGGAMIWDRTYHFAGRRPVTVSSCKAMDSSLGLMEVVHGGVGMALRVSVEDGALHFRSRRYFWDIAGLRIPLPLLVSPGEAHVAHIDRGGGVFEFRMSFTHPWFGRLFEQTGLFSDPSKEGVT